jgi:DNA-binding response OmpR family regulator
MQPPPRAGQTPTILVVNDDARFRRILRANFEVVGFDVVDARDGDERIGERAALVKKEAKRRRGSVVVTERELSR